MKEIGPDIYVETAYHDVTLGVIAAEEGIVCVDSPPSPADAREWVDHLRATFRPPIRYLILTDHNGDRAVNAHVFDTRVVAHAETQTRLQEYGPEFPPPVMESVAARYGLAQSEFYTAPVTQPQVSFTERADIHLGEREITLLHTPSATPGSTWVYISEEELLFTGDSVVIGQHPPLAEADSKSWLDALVRLRRQRFPAKIIVPGRGPLCSKSETEPVSDYIRMVRRRVYSVYRAGRPRADTTALIPDLLAAFPDTPVPEEWLQRHLKTDLDHIYDEYRAADSPRPCWSQL